MATIMIDYENVHAKDGLRGVEYLTGKDTLHIFFSDSCRSMREDCFETIQLSGCIFKTTKLLNCSKNALDFYIACECGMAAERGEKNLLIVSADKGFNAVSDYLQKCQQEWKIQVVTATSIEKGLMKINDPSDQQRREQITAKTKLLDIVAANERYTQHRELRDKLYSLFGGSEQESKRSSILDFASINCNRSKKELYTSALHRFGRTDGLEIYKKIRDVI